MGRMLCKKVRLYIALTFRPILAAFSNFQKGAEIGKKRKAIT
jgi:hypothetical protein